MIGLVMIALTGIDLPAYAQQSTFDFNSTSVAFRAVDGNEYDITIELAGFVFNENLEYDAVTYGTISPYSVPAYSAIGYFQAGTSGSAGGDVDEIAGTLGCARYKFTIATGDHSKSFFLDLTDHRWFDPDTTRGILFDLEDGYSEIDIRCWCQVEHGSGLVHYCWVDNNDNLKFWKIVRADGTCSDGKHERGRDGFILPEGHYPQVIAKATLDVNVLVTGDIVIPADSVVYVETDADPLDNGDETIVRFEDGHRLTVYGSLVSNQSYGITIWTSSNQNPDEGDWEGIHADDCDTLYMLVAEVSYARVAVTIEDCRTINGTYAVLDGCSLMHSSFAGLDIVNSDPDINWCYIEQNMTFGARVGGTYATPVFSWTHIWNTLPASDGGGYGDGLLGITDADITIEDCNIHENAANGIHLVSGKAKIINSLIHDHDNGNGIFLEDSRLWTTVQTSRIYENRNGIRLEDSAKIRGWYASPEPASSNIWKVSDSLGRNCISMNDTNIVGDGLEQFDLGRAYYDTAQVPHYLGRENDIVYPGEGLQVVLLNGAKGSFQMDFWDGNTNADVDGTSTFTFDPDTASSVGNCSESAPFGPVRPPDRIAALLDPLPFDPDRDICSQAHDAAKARARRSSTSTGGESQPDAADGYALYPASPNPFTLNTAISFAVPREQHVSLEIYDMLGRKLSTPADGVYCAGRHTVLFPASGLAGGTYVYVMRADARVMSRTMVIEK